MAVGQDFGLVALAHAMPGQPRLLVDRFDRYKAHVALARRGGNRLGIVAVVLCGPALAERRHELGGDQLRGQPIRLATPCPMMGAAADRKSTRLNSSP